MIRKIYASAKTKNTAIESMKISIEIKTDWLTREETNKVVERVKNWAFDKLRQEGFLLQDIKTN